MITPGFTAEASLGRTGTPFTERADFGQPGRSSVLAQVCGSTPCVRIGGGQWCPSIPLIGRKCFNIPSAGSWRIRCCTRWGWPPVSCSISRC